jgi:hypothetical protein
VVARRRCLDPVGWSAAVSADRLEVVGLEGAMAGRESFGRCRGRSCWAWSRWEPRITVNRQVRLVGGRRDQWVRRPRGICSRQCFAVEAESRQGKTVYSGGRLQLEGFQTPSGFGGALSGSGEVTGAKLVAMRNSAFLRRFDGSSVTAPTPAILPDNERYCEDDAATSKMPSECSKEDGERQRAWMKCQKFGDAAQTLVDDPTR